MPADLKGRLQILRAQLATLLQMPSNSVIESVKKDLALDIADVERRIRASEAPGARSVLERRLAVLRRHLDLLETIRASDHIIRPVKRDIAEIEKRLAATESDGESR